LRDLTDCTIAVDVNALAEPFDSGATAQAGSLLESHDASPAAHEGDDPGVAGQASPEVLDARDAAAPARRVGPDGQKAGTVLDSLLEQRGHHADAHELGPVELFARSLETVQTTITRLKLAAQPPDLLITIPRNACASYEFHRAEELIEIGRLRTREALKRWHRPRPRRPAGP
jgi:NTE family protein